MYNRDKKYVLPCFCILIFFHATLQFLLKDRKGKTLVEEYDKYENTPLHVAAKKGYVRIVQVGRSDLYNLYKSFLICLIIFATQLRAHAFLRS